MNRNPSEDELRVLKALFSRASQYHPANKKGIDNWRPQGPWDMRLMVSDIDINLFLLSNRFIVKAPEWSIDSTSGQGFVYEDEGRLKTDLTKIAILIDW